MMIDMLLDMKMVTYLNFGRDRRQLRNSFLFLENCIQFLMVKAYFQAHFSLAEMLMMVMQMNLLRQIKSQKSQKYMVPFFQMEQSLL